MLQWIIHSIRAWCNGNIAALGAVVEGSIPSALTITRNESEPDLDGSNAMNSFVSVESVDRRNNFSVQAILDALLEFSESKHTYVKLTGYVHGDSCELQIAPHGAPTTYADELDELLSISESVTKSVQVTHEWHRNGNSVATVRSDEPTVFRTSSLMTTLENMWWDGCQMANVLLDADKAVFTVIVTAPAIDWNL